MILKAPFTPELRHNREAILRRGAHLLGKDFNADAVGFRTFDTSDLECKERKASGGMVWELSGLATSASLDNDDEVVLPGGADWSVFERYKALYTDHWYGTGNVVGTLRLITRKGDGWWIKATMMPDDFGVHIAQTRELAARKALGFSIGFMATDRGQPTPEEKKAYPLARSIVRRWKAFEVSTTPMPCNLDCGATVMQVDGEKAADLLTKGLLPAWARGLVKRRRVVVLA